MVALVPATEGPVSVTRGRCHSVQGGQVDRETLVRTSIINQVLKYSRYFPKQLLLTCVWWTFLLLEPLNLSGNTMLWDLYW